MFFLDPVSAFRLHHFDISFAVSAIVKGFLSTCSSVIKVLLNVHICHIHQQLILPSQNVGCQFIERVESP